MTRQIIAATLALSLGFTGAVSAPARAEGQDVSRLLSGIVTLGVIGAAIHEDRQRERREDRERAERRERDNDERGNARGHGKDKKKDKDRDRDDDDDDDRDDDDRDDDGDDRRGRGDERRSDRAREAAAMIAAIMQARREAGQNVSSQAEAQARSRAEAEADAARRNEIARAEEAQRAAEANARAAARREAEARRAEPVPSIPRDEVTADQLRDWQPEQTAPAQQVAGEIPLRCLTRQQATFDGASMVDGDCLDDYPQLSRSLPLDCAVARRDEGRILSGYDTDCLRGRGYRIAVR